MHESLHAKWTIWIALTAIFTALTTVGTVLLSVSLPAGGYFNFGEAVIYIAALSLGPINMRGSRVPLGAIIAGIAGGLGAMLGDVILGYMQYIPATICLKFAEGFVAGMIFKQLAPRNPENRESGVTTIRVLLSGFFLAAAIIILGVNYDPGSLVLWIAISGAFITIAFLSIMRGKIPLYYMALSLLAGGIVMFFGYFVYELFILDIMYAYANLPWNAIQALIGIIVAIPVYQALQKATLFQSLS